MWEECGVGDQSAARDVGVEFGHPRPDAVGVEDLVPRRVQRVGDIHPAAVPADLNHLRAAAKRQVRRSRVGFASHDPSQANRCRLARVERVADVELLEFACAPA